MQVFRSLFGSSARDRQTQNSHESNNIYDSLYPESIRYSLRYNGGRMGKSEILALLDRFVHEAQYLVVKALASDREQQRQYLCELTRLFMREDYNDDQLRQLLRYRVNALPDDVTVKGAKLAQLNRSGSSNWQQAFHDLAVKTLNEKPDAVPTLIAFTTMLAYQHFVQIYQAAGAPKIFIIVPEWLLDPDETYMGYSVSLKPHLSVELKPKSRCIFGNWTCQGEECPMSRRYCGNAVFIDDTINTRTTVRKIASFWQSEYALILPEDRIRVITDLRDSQDMVHLMKPK